MNPSLGVLEIAKQEFFLDFKENLAFWKLAKSSDLLATIKSLKGVVRSVMKCFLFAIYFFITFFVVLEDFLDSKVAMCLISDRTTHLQR